MQSVIATALLIASGAPNQAAGIAAKNGKPCLKTLFEQVRLNKASPDVPRHHYLPLPLTAGSIFPEQGDGSAEDASSASRELWDGLLRDLGRIPVSHARSLSLWLDHFDTLLMTYTQSVPSTEDSACDVPLYDHAKTAAAIAASLWRCHRDNGSCDTGAARALSDRSDWDKPKLLFVQGNFHAIQSCIFAAGANTNRQAAKILRGRSYYVSLMAELAALKILKALWNFHRAAKSPMLQASF